MTAPGANMTYT